MSEIVTLSSQPKKLFHHRNGSDELDVFEAARYFSGSAENINRNHKTVSGEARIFSNNMQKYSIRPIGRTSLDMPNHRGDSIPLKAMLIENPMMINKEKKSKQPSSPGGKLAHFLNSLFNQTSLKKSKSKTKSSKDEDESPSGWRSRRRSSISHFRSGNSNSTATIISDTRSPFSTSTLSSGFKTPPPYHQPHTPTKSTSYRDPRSYSYLKPPPSQITEISINGSLKKIENFNIIKNDKYESIRYGYVEKANILEDKPADKYVSRKDIKEFKRGFINDENDDGADSDSSSDLFELANCDLSYCSSGLPVYETTRIDSIKRGAPISS